MKLQFEPNSFMDVNLRLLKGLLKPKVLSTPGIMIYGYAEPKTKIAKFFKQIPIILLLFVVVDTGIGAILGPYNLADIAVCFVASCALAYVVHKRKIWIKRTEQADEYLSMWLLKNYPNERINTRKLLTGMDAGSSGNLYMLIIDAHKAELFVFEEEAEKLVTTQPLTRQIVEYK